MCVAPSRLTPPALKGPAVLTQNSQFRDTLADCGSRSPIEWLKVLLLVLGTAWLVHEHEVCRQLPLPQTGRQLQDFPKRAPCILALRLANSAHRAISKEITLRQIWCYFAQLLLANGKR